GVVCASSEIERPAWLVEEAPAQCAVNQSLVHLFVDIVDEPVYLRVVGKTYVNYFAVYSERAFLRFSTHRENHIEVLQNFVDRDVYIGVNPANPNRAVQARQPTRRCDRKLPWLTLRNRWRRGFFRRQFYGTCCRTADGCKQCPCKEKQFNSHGSILWSPKPKS